LGSKLEKFEQNIIALILTLLNNMDLYQVPSIIFMQKLLGVVVLYHPEKEVLQNIQTYLPKLGTLLLIDNSQPSSKHLFDQLLADTQGQIKYIHNSANEGIAKPLNQAAEYGIKNNFDWLLTMDQDSFFHPNHLDRLIQFTLQNDTSRIGIATPVHHTPKALLPAFKEPFSEVRITMTSGNLLSLSAYQACGPFDENLFIDSVDHEYCLRLRKKGYKVIRVNNSILDHKLGDILYKKILLFKVKVTNHNTVRRYYIARNRLYVMFKYAFSEPVYFLKEAFQYIKDFMKICLIEDDKVKKLLQFVKGTGDFIQNKYSNFK
jgi:rhamnosyltransferase